MSLALEVLCADTDTRPEDWDETDGPVTGVGVERWFVNRDTGRMVYTCDDQGVVKWEYSGDD